MYQSLQKLASLPLDTQIFCGHEYTLDNIAFALQVEPNNLELKLYKSRVESLINSNQPSLPSTIKQELAVNPFLRCHIQQVIEKIKEKWRLIPTNKWDIFEQLRVWKNHGF
jgi:hydroxyacylglutathione hydrolase